MLPALTPGSKYYSVEELAHWLKVTPQTIRNWAKQGQLQGIRVGKLWRFTPEAVKNFVDHGFKAAGH